MANYSNEDGVWRTIGGRRVFIRNGQSLSDAMKESGKFNNSKKQKVEKENNVKKDDLDEKELDDFENKSSKALPSNSGQEKISKDTKVMHYGDDFIVTKKGANIGEFKSQSQAEAFAKSINEQFEVSDLKKKAMETLPKEDIDTHEGDLYIKKTKESEALLKNMKNADSGMLSTFKDQQTGETWYDVPFGNMEDDYKEKTWRDKIKNPNTRDEILDKELDESTKSKTKEFWNKEDLNGTDLNKFNDKATANFGKIDYYGNGRKSNAVRIEMELKDGVFSASGFIKNAKGTDSVSGGQNLDEIADLMKDNKDVQEIHSLWKKYHLNDMHAGTEKQEEALEKFKGERKSIAEKMNKDKKYDWEKVDENDYKVTKKLLENHNLLNDNGYQYGTSWLKREIPDQDKKRIIELINKYNGKTDETKTTNDIMNETFRKKAYKNYLKQHPGSKMTFEDFKKKK